MKAEDVIFYKPDQKEKLRESLQKRLENALFSFPFWANPMEIRNIQSGIHTVIKNSLSKSLFALFAEDQNLYLDFKSGQESFPHSHRFDFSFENTCWHIENNFVQNQKPLSAEEYVYLPALIPNHYKNDTWSKRNEIVDEYESTGYLFTFLNEDPDKNNPVFDVHIDHRIISFLSDYRSKYEVYKLENPPYSESRFWDEFMKIAEKPQIKINKVPTLVIAGVAQENHFGYFADTDEKANLCYRLYRGKWYENREKGGLSFCKGLIQTEITNATCPMAALASFNSVFLIANNKHTV